MKKTLKIDTYDPVIYPRLFWVTDELEGLDRVFEFITIYSGGEKTTDFEELMKLITCYLICINQKYDIMDIRILKTGLG